MDHFVCRCRLPSFFFAIPHLSFVSLFADRCSAALQIAAVHIVTLPLQCGAATLAVVECLSSLRVAIAIWYRSGGVSRSSGRCGLWGALRLW
ncbi:Hypothetical predicted protein [Olea europaea subsp. europaea]|uniref:Uncharacterized protein n=1 Tax=Olea europaea subsp. europaea TaxID=158383 RepID=A0A8S0TSM9_OLEEU|nr:Hypothetical predicted protein [Olea europaea subsp. europaea]